MQLSQVEPRPTYLITQLVMRPCLTVTAVILLDRRLYKARHLPMEEKAVSIVVLVSNS